MKEKTNKERTNIKLSSVARASWQKQPHAKCSQAVSRTVRRRAFNAELVADSNEIRAADDETREKDDISEIPKLPPPRPTLPTHGSRLRMRVMAGLCAKPRPAAAMRTMLLARGEETRFRARIAHCEALPGAGLEFLGREPCHAAKPSGKRLPRKDRSVTSSAPIVPQCAIFLIQTKKQAHKCIVRRHFGARVFDMF